MRNTLLTTILAAVACAAIVLPSPASAQCDEGFSDDRTVLDLELGWDYYFGGRWLGRISVDDGGLEMNVQVYFASHLNVYVAEILARDYAGLGFPLCIVGDSYNVYGAGTGSTPAIALGAAAANVTTSSGVVTVAISDGGFVVGQSVCVTLACERTTIVIDGCDSEVDDVVVDFVSYVAELTNILQQDGLITGKQKGAIQKCAAQSDIPIALPE